MIFVNVILLIFKLSIGVFWNHFTELGVGNGGPDSDSGHLWCPVFGSWLSASLRISKPRCIPNDYEPCLIKISFIIFMSCFPLLITYVIVKITLNKLILI